MSADAPGDPDLARLMAEHPVIALHVMRCKVRAQSAILALLIGVVAETESHWDPLLLKILGRALDQIEQAEQDPGERAAVQIAAMDIVGRARAALLTNEPAPSALIN